MLKIYIFITSPGILLTFTAKNYQNVANTLFQIMPVLVTLVVVIRLR